jgi:hypothetical protein
MLRLLAEVYLLSQRLFNCELRTPRLPHILACAVSGVLVLAPSSPGTAHKAKGQRRSAAPQNFLLLLVTLVAGRPEGLASEAPGAWANAAPEVGWQLKSVSFVWLMTDVFGNVGVTSPPGTDAKPTSGSSVLAFGSKNAAIWQSPHSWQGCKSPATTKQVLALGRSHVKHVINNVGILL